MIIRIVHASLIGYMHPGRVAMQQTRGVRGWVVVMLRGKGGAVVSS